MRTKLLFRLCLCGLLLMPQAAFGQQLDFSYEKHHIFFPASVNGKTARLIFDTGSAYFCMDSTFFADSGLEFSQRGKAMMKGSGDGIQQVDIIFSGVSISLGGISFQPVPVPIINLRAILNNPADGIFGMGDLKEKVIAIDYPERKIAFLDALAPGMTDGYTQVDIEYDPAYPWRIMFPLEVTLSSGTVISGKALIDSGAGEGIEFTNAAAMEFHLDQLEEREPYHMDVGGIGGSAAGYDFTITGASIGGLPVPITKAGYSSNQSGALASNAYIAVVGNRMWEHFALILDLKGRKLYLRFGSENRCRS